MIKRSFFENSPIGVCIVKKDRTSLEVVYANKALAHMMRLRDNDASQLLQIKPDDLIGKPLEKIWPSNDINQLVKELKSTTPPKEYSLPVYDGTKQMQRWAKLSITQDEFEDQPAYILWATDISSSKEAEESLKEAVEQADAMAEMKSNFLATMSHEIRTPMQTIYGLLELIMDEQPNDRVKTMVQTAIDSASGLLEILNDILDIAKMDANKMELDMFEVPLRTLLSGIIEALSVRVQGKKVELYLDVNEDVPAVILGDPQRLRQIVMNLTGNALKFTELGSVTIHVSVNEELTKLTASNNTILRFEITDTGIGMAPDTVDKLFKPFNQADNSTSRQFGGTGLGLSISKKLVELMGGDIGVRSEEGIGSTFWFEIPTEEIGENNTVLDLPNLTGLSVLSVDDHPIGAKEIARSLESMGATIETCGSCAEAIALVKRRPFDVALIDQGLPDGLGMDLMRRLTKLRPFMGMVMYTVRDDLGLQHSCSKIGATFLSKPASRLGLGTAVLDASSKAARYSIDGPTKLLIAEDTESVQDVFKRQLDKLGVDADIVDNGQKALDALETGNYGILITDLHMPILDGYQVVETIRQGETMLNDGSPPFPVIALTADVQMAQRDTYLRHGFDECLLKPVSLGQFKRLLMRWGLLRDEDSDEGESEIHEVDSGDFQQPDIAIDDPNAAPEKILEDVITTSAVNVAAQKAEQKPDHPPAIDRDKLIMQMGEIDEDCVEMLQMFADMTVALVNSIRNAYDNGDYELLHRQAHSLKGGARTACCTIFGELAAQLQDDSEEKLDTCGQLVADIEVEFKRVVEEIRNITPES